ncbi:MAG TPA: nitrilase-related carbon-nitrogen hydrolase, partial [Pseudoxanthomonas sp.]|nr:nitrilase-related carbon-nitrogen hydrolase [Pseudoxanthomonas sp.]
TFAHPRSGDGAALDREIQEFVDTLGVPLVFGTYDLDEGSEYNAAAFVEPQRGLLGFYRKTYPFPLAEHVPRWLDGPALRRWLPWAGAWRAGHGARVMPLRSADGRELNVLPLICLDDVHPGLAIDGTRLGAQAIVGMSNDSWFTDHPAGARLHLSVAAFRSIETRLPQVRVTTNGLSAIIDSTGEIAARTDMGSRAVLTAELAAQDPVPTLMVRWGDWVGRTAGLFLLALLVLAGWRTVPHRTVRTSAAPFAAEAVLLTRGWRVAAGALRLCAGAGLVWIAVDMAQRFGLQVQSLSQLERFGLAVVLPAVAAWAIERRFAAKVRLEGSALVLDQRRQRIEIPLAAIAALRPWRLPLPRAGVDLALAAGHARPRGLALADPMALRQALAEAGSPARIEGPLSAPLARLAHVRAAATRLWLDHALVKFALFPLLPAAVAFRLHQVIAFGGPLGEYYTYGLKAWLTGAAIWWASWSLGLMLFAAAVRIVIECVTLLALPLPDPRRLALREATMWLGRAAFFVGVPAWLGLRLVSG